MVGKEAPQCGGSAAPCAAFRNEALTFLLRPCRVMGICLTLLPANCPDRTLFGIESPRYSLARQKFDCRLEDLEGGREVV